MSQAVIDSPKTKDRRNIKVINEARNLTKTLKDVLVIFSDEFKAMSLEYLTKNSSLKQSSIYYGIRHLKKHGWIKSTPFINDMRGAKYKLTEKAETLFSHIQKSSDKSIDIIFQKQ